MVYKWYILPIGGLYATYHLLGEPETTIDFKLTSNSNGDVERIFPGEMFAYHFFFRYTWVMNGYKMWKSHQLYENMYESLRKRRKWDAQ